ncbi:endonuclease/exonuclease/phosphatase family protein [Allorhodopirellula solitaria]|uniref:Endonuclease/Exonuclease/phosphatase family protein n=1 Tax=Allorhodopirellula solitaria TaxID=2527987 RepID=A0A5C5XZ18_9BACT|nr:endonuclease/exonuclease/phosphatase family protein [Allorhodopirellula solitaria]TWT67185.1 Endonuclease/Exonuclease/phosphatase family protein [Allorhodopirellula solitaria]
MFADDGACTRTYRPLLRGSRNASHVVASIHFPRTLYAGFQLLQTNASRLLRALSFVLVIATVASMLAPFHWVFDTVANLRVQGLIAIAVLSGGALLLRSWWILVVAAMLLLINLSMMNFGTLADAGDFGSHSGLRIVTTNVLASNPRHDEIIDELESIDADVIVVVELGAKLAARAGEFFRDSHPYQVFHERETGDFGIGLMSRLPLRSDRALRLDGCPLTLEVVLDDYRIIATHPLPPIGQHGFIHRNRQLAMIAEQVRPELARPTQTIMVGDFNLTPWNANFTHFLYESGLRRVGPRWDLRPTWYARLDPPPGLRTLLGLQIDHVLISDDLVGTDYHIGHYCGSDHRSVSVRLHRREP